MVFDDTLLDDPARLADADTAGLLRATAMAGAQVRACVEVAQEAELRERLDVGRPRSVVLIGRTGVGNVVAKLTASLLTPGSPVPIVLSEVVPSWIGALDVVCAHTDDPYDRELASSLERAGRYGASVVLSAPAEGPVAASVAGKGVLLAPRVVVGSGQAFARALAVGLLAVSALNLIEADFVALADELDAEAERSHLGHETFVNPAKSLALKLAERTPLLWGLDPVATAVGEHAAHVLASDAAVVADVADYRQAASRGALHRAAVGTMSGEDLFADPDDPETARERLRLLFLAVRSDEAAVATRQVALDTFTSAEVLDIADEIQAAEPVRAAVLALRFELAAVYLGLAAGTIGGANRFTPVQA